MGLYSISTDSNVPEILKNARTEANFISVTDTGGKRILLNVRSIVSVREMENPSSDSVVSDIVGGVLGAILGPSKTEEKTVITIDEEED